MPIETPEELKEAVKAMMYEVCSSYEGKAMTQRTGDEISFLILNRLMEMKYQGRISENCRCGAFCEFMDARRYGYPYMRIVARYVPVFELKEEEVPIFLS